ncbi:MAG: hypothetical protein B5M53_05280 [Candidatus Cloacimonas sp. 4484_209]|nr:MAG: hypothetical protein B5M53_05280 [Candidatus Cloacimonas sp. 4484_209]
MKKFTSQEIKEFLSKPHFDEKAILNKNLSWPKISIVTPSYNQAEFLERTILSVLNQNYPNLEYIIIDGGSTDGSVEIIKKYQKYLAYWVSESDRGQSHALNKGFCLCTGEYIGWQNSDDIYLPGTFHSFARRTQRHPAYDIYYAHQYVIDKDENIIRPCVTTRPSKFYEKYRGMIVRTQSSFFSKSMLSVIGLMDEKLQFAMDRDFFLRAVLSNRRLFFVNEFWGAFRWHESCKSGGNNKAAWIVERRYISKKYRITSEKHLKFKTQLARLWKGFLIIQSGNWWYFFER